MTWLLRIWLHESRQAGPPCALPCAPRPAAFPHLARLARDGTKVSSALKNALGGQIAHSSGGRRSCRNRSK